jgi:hypothetical protein
VQVQVSSIVRWENVRSMVVTIQVVVAEIRAEEEEAEIPFVVDLMEEEGQVAEIRLKEGAGVAEDLVAVEMEEQGIREEEAVTLLVAGVVEGVDTMLAEEVEDVEAAIRMREN